METWIRVSKDLEATENLGRRSDVFLKMGFLVPV